MLTRIIDLLITILAACLFWWVWDRFLSKPEARYHWPFGLFNDVVVMILLGGAVLVSVAGVFYPEYSLRVLLSGPAAWPP